MSRLPNIVRLAGPERGLDGRSVLSKARAPLITDGRIGDFWIDTVSKKLFGPKTAAGWPDNGLIRGAAGWYPLERIASDGVRRVTEVYDWAGGEGTKPAIGYKTAAGALTETIGDAADIRGAPGPEFLIDAMGDGGDDVSYATQFAGAEVSGDNEKRPLTHLFGPGSKLDVRSTAAAATTVVPASIGTVVVWDLGGRFFRRTDADPGPVTKFRSADRFLSDGETDLANGGWWAISPDMREPLDESVTDAKVASPADPAALIDGNKLRYQDGIDPFPLPLVTRDRRWMWITDTDQITGNGTSNDQAGVERAIEKACLNGRKLLIPDDIVIRLTEPVENHGNLSLKIAGSGVEVVENNNYATNGINTRGKGSWFFFDHEGVGFDFEGRSNGVNLVGNAHIGIFGIGTMRDQPTPESNWEPGDFDFDFRFTQCTADIDDLTLWNPTMGLQWRRARSGQLNIGLIRGQPLNVGIDIVNAYDVIRIKDIHFWPFWSLSDPVREYTRDNAHALISNRSDGMMVDNLFSIRYKRSLLIGNYAGDGPDNPAGTTYHASFGNIYADLGESALIVAEAANGVSAHFDRIICEQAPEVTAFAAGVAVLGPNARLHIGTLVSNNTQASAVSVSGVASRVNISRFQPGNFNLSETGFPAIACQASGAVVRLSEVSDNGSGDGAPLTYEDAGGKITGHKTTGVATVLNGQNGATVIHGLGVTPRGVHFSLLGAGAQAVGTVLPRIASLDQNSFTLDLGITVGADRSFSWEAFI
ncbi:hypothetical protein IED13_15515 [Bosea sp. SSUT16]|uniref:Uncharacterized protein n=1 Tax=Bosea spartocytisi TaxID=2773451 RepID=A0A927EAW3_9HYPH|nr:hypothetical protein [Bosea spartocytisi]MBD3847117.1 hypothetical protein [Bosea spartocytisi]MCT4474187.1 hypothetical protein [Bosea spartocytisi]